MASRKTTAPSARGWRGRGFRSTPPTTPRRITRWRRCRWLRDSDWGAGHREQATGNRWCLARTPPVTRRLFPVTCRHILLTSAESKRRYAAFLASSEELMRIRVFAVLAALAIAASAQMQESITVNVVEVPVTVVDGSGNPVRGLTAANFKLYDQGKEVAITGIDTIHLPAKPAQSG